MHGKGLREQRRGARALFLMCMHFCFAPVLSRVVGQGLQNHQKLELKPLTPNTVSTLTWPVQYWWWDFAFPALLAHPEKNEEQYQDIAARHLTNFKASEKYGSLSAFGRRSCLALRLPARTRGWSNADFTKATRRYQSPGSGAHHQKSLSPHLPKLYFWKNCGLMMHQRFAILVASTGLSESFPTNTLSARWAKVGRGVFQG